MKVSYNWLQEYIKNPLPKVEELSRALTMHSFEIEGVEDMGHDSVIDVKVLPNRASDCLCHFGVASEVASVCNLERIELLETPTLSKTEKINLSLNTKQCERGFMILVRDVKVGESPEWLREKLAILGQRSINSVVDLTNYLTFAFGHPMHAFDAEKISLDKNFNYQLNIRHAKDGEKITLLNGTEYSLTEDMVVIADDEKALDVAGVMGGDDSKVTESTKNIILSMSHFNPVSIRKTAKKLGLRTEASHRFENGLSRSLAERSLPYLLKNILEITGGIVDGMVEEEPLKEVIRKIPITSKKISTILGFEVSDEEIISILAKQRIWAGQSEEGLVVSVPKDRLDITIEESVAEEVGRIYGYENIKPKKFTDTPALGLNVRFFVADKIRNVLVKSGYSEVYTYAFVKGGEVVIANALSGDKKYLRTNLGNAMGEALEENFKHLDLLGLKELKMFEIGTIFKKEEEGMHLCLGVKYPKGKKGNVDEEVARVINLIESELDVSLGDISIVGGVAEFNLNRVLENITAPAEYGKDLWDIEINDNFLWKTISPYPFAVRDVAVFVPNEVSVEKVIELINKNINSLVVRLSLFDTFVKSEKTSYAFRLVFQASDRTLTDEEINAVMNPIYESLKGEEGFEIR
ncbi:MAG: phenylalanine--tRNA ligase subunit beta [Patescibacteria group bacterium]